MAQQSRAAQPDRKAFQNKIGKNDGGLGPRQKQKSE